MHPLRSFPKSDKILASCEKILFNVGFFKVKSLHHRQWFPPTVIAVPLGNIKPRKFIQDAWTSMHQLREEKIFSANSPRIKPSLLPGALHINCLQSDVYRACKCLHTQTQTRHTWTITVLPSACRMSLYDLTISVCAPQRVSLCSVFPTQETNHRMGGKFY